MKTKLTSAGIGLVAGLSAGLFGVGGGVIAVPGLVVLLGMTQVTAAATSLAAIVVSATAALVPYIAAGNVAWGAASVLLVGGAVGAVAANKVLHLIPNKTLSVVFSLVVLAAAIRMLTSSAPADQVTLALTTGMVVLLLVLGFISGALATGLGIGGAVVYVPVLVLGIGLVQHVAQGTALAVIVPTAIIGTYGHHKRNRVRWKTAALVAGGGLVGGLIGAFGAQAIEPDRLRFLFAVMIMVLAIRMVARVFASTREPAET